MTNPRQEKKDKMAKIESIKEISKDIFDMLIYAPEIASSARPGQFVNVCLNDASKLLPRPISICGFDKARGTVRIVFRIAGAGTAELSEMKEGDELKVMGPLGNGFHETQEKNALLFGGGIGIPPMLGLAKSLHEKGVNVTTVLGYRDSDLFLSEEFKYFGNVIIATDDGSKGFKGNVVEAAKKYVSDGTLSLTDTCIYACGPIPMLRGLKTFASDNSVPAQLSMEERMACGIGACLACVCKSTEIDAHSNVKNKRVCKDGPVFWAGEIEI